MNSHDDLHICASTTGSAEPVSESKPPALLREFETERAVMRPFCFADLDDVFAYASDPSFGQYIPLPRPYLREHAEEFLARMRLADWSSSCTWAIVPKGLGRVSGSVRFDLQWAHHKGDLGWGIAPALWGQGLTFEVTHALVELVFTRLPELLRVEAHVDQRNRASLRVAEKLGMQREGTLHSFLIVHDEPVDVAMFGLLRARWAERHATRRINSARPAL